MKIYPAIDIYGGKAVRLRQGRATDATVYGDPVEMAEKWASRGAEWLHVVDLDGAFEGVSKNLDVLRVMSRSAGKSVKIQTGGGIRNMSTIETLLEAGVQRVVLGTAAVNDQAFVREALARYPRQVAIGIDARDGKAQVAGWTEDSSIAAIDLAQQLEAMGAGLVIYTDISRDGVLEGPNVEATLAMIENTGLSVIASGGVSSIDDIRRIAGIVHPRLDGVIIGKALYEGRIQLEEALACAR
jgi:phosphoribosylformimino-5-aminoimidazole carboxamide ribotide isomerase